MADARPAVAPAEIVEIAVVIVATGIAMKRAVLAKWEKVPAAADYNCATSCPIWELHSHFHLWKEAVARFAHLPAVGSNNDCSLRFLYSPRVRSLHGPDCATVDACVANQRRWHMVCKLRSMRDRYHVFVPASSYLVRTKTGRVSEKNGLSVQTNKAWGINKTAILGHRVYRII